VGRRPWRIGRASIIASGPAVRPDGTFGLAKRQEPNLPFPLALDAALSQQNEIDRRVPSKDTTDDVVVEVFIRGESDHDGGLLPIDLR